MQKYTIPLPFIVYFSIRGALFRPETTPTQHAPRITPRQLPSPRASSASPRGRAVRDPPEQRVIDRVPDLAHEQRAAGQRRRDERRVGAEDHQEELGIIGQRR
jgi:hypothetical protein